MRGAARYVLIGLVVVAALPAALADRWYEHYERAGDALDNGRWADAVDELEGALARRGDSGARVRTYGMNFISYFPYLRLGIARFELGEYESALAALEIEKQAGAIDDSSADLRQLQDYLERSRRAMGAEQDDERQRIVTDRLGTARGLEQRGEFQEALRALGDVLAVDSANTEAVALEQRLLQRISDLEKSRADRERAGRLTDDGEAELAAGRPAQAASLFRRALSLDPDDRRATTLLETASRRLAEESRTRSDTAQRTRSIADGLVRARELEQGGDLTAALDALQEVRALDPANDEADGIERRLLERQRESERRTARLDRIGTLLVEADAKIEAGAYREALDLLNRARSLDAANEDALRRAGITQRLLMDELLRGEEEANLAPRFLFQDDRQHLCSGTTCAKLDLPLEELEAIAADVDAVEAELQRDDSYTLSGSLEDGHPFVARIYRNDSLIETLESRYLVDRHRLELKVSSRLVPGVTEFRIDAEDELGEATTYRYSVVYLRPFFRSPTLYVGLIGLVLAGAAGLVVLRVRRGIERRRRRENPFIAGAPVLADEMFFGRERLMRRVLQTVPNNSMMLYGERRIGKTSFQHRLKRRLAELDDPTWSFFPVYVDLQGTPEERFFATLAEEIFHELEPQLDGVTPHESLHDAAASYAHRTFVRDLRRVLEALADKTDKRVKLALLIDEVDELNAYHPRTNQRLRSLFMRDFAENVVAVVSGVGIKKHWESEGSPWYNFFEEVPVEPFRSEDAEQLVRGPLQGLFGLEHGVVDRILSLTDCKPYLIQKMGVALVNRLHEENRRKITLADVEAIGKPEEVETS